MPESAASSSPRKLARRSLLGKPKLPTINSSLNATSAARNALLPKRFFFGDDRHEVGQVEHQAADILHLDVFILHEHAGHPRARRNAASPRFKSEDRLVAVGHFALDAEH